VSGATTIAAGAIARATVDERIALAWRALGGVEDPEIPCVSIIDLGLIRFVHAEAHRLDVGLSPTYVGCPATEVIRRDVEAALREAQVGAFAVTLVLSPAWSSDWITPEGRRKLELNGIAPPERVVSSARACPRCHSMDTETVSEFGSTPCKALHRCRSCLEPFEYFKCI
jgi:ring-1,2-phenylacetyl-CoA epoxidase subunit PaaD